MIDDAALAMAIRARRGRLNIAKKGTLGLGHIARAAATCTGDKLAAVGSTGAVTILACSESLVVNGLRAATGGLFKRYRKSDGHIATVLSNTCTASGACIAPKEGREDIVAHPAKDIADVNETRTHGAICCAVLVIVRALLLIRKNGVRLVKLFEFLFGLRIVRDVGMNEASLLEERFLDSSLIGILIDTEYLVVVPALRHDLYPPQTITNTGRIRANANVYTHIMQAQNTQVSQAHS